MSLEKLYNDLKPIGNYQIWAMIVLVGARTLINMITFMPVLTAGVQEYSCASFLNNNSSPDSFNVTCGAPSNSNSSCLEWRFDENIFTSTIRSQFSLVCSSEYLAEFSITLYFIGCLFGDLVFGFLSDRFGRKRTLIASSTMIFLFSLSSAFAPTFWIYCLTRVLAGVGDGGTLNVGFTMLTETSTSKSTVTFSFIFFNGWSFGILIIAIVGYFVRDHWYLEIILSVPQVLIPILVCTLHESMRWLISKGRLDEADRVAKAIAKRNRVAVPSDFTVKKYVNEAILATYKNESKLPGIKPKDLLKYPRVLHVSIIVSSGWFVTAFGCYATSLGVSMLDWQLHFVLALSAAVEIVSRICGSFVARRFGRIKGICISLDLSGILCLVSIAFLFDESMNCYLIVTSLVAKFFITISSDITCTYTAELFPTSMRNVGISVGCACSRVGAMMAPLILTLQKYSRVLPFFVLGVMPLATSFVLIILPDTRGHRLVEQIEQFDEFLEKKCKHSPWLWNKKKEPDIRIGSTWSVDLGEEIYPASSAEDEESEKEQLPLTCDENKTSV